MKKALNSYCVLNLTNPWGKIFYCSAFCVAKNILLTASHCLEGRTPYLIENQRRWNVEEIFSISSQELTFLFCPCPFEPVELREPELLEEVVVPVRFESYIGMLSAGRVAFIDEIFGRVVLSNKILSGTSGAPIIASDGRVIGMIIGGLTWKNQISELFSYGISASVIKKYLEKAIEEVKKWKK